jgi:HEXXH motif-containing protein
VNDNEAAEEFQLHRLSWTDFDELSQSVGNDRIISQLRGAERSRRLLLLRALVDKVAKTPELCGPLPSLETAWELLERVESKTPAVFDLIIGHPYTGSWVGYTTRLLLRQTTGVCPLWVHIGYLHSLAAAAAVRARLPFQTSIPVWQGGAILPTLGMARLPSATRYSTAEVRGGGGQPEIRLGTARVALPDGDSTGSPGWWPVRSVRVQADGRVLSVRLDDLDPYRGLYEPVPPQRLNAVEVETWRALLGDAWELIVRHLPETATDFQAGLRSLVPRPAVPFRMPSASTAEAFGSAILSRPVDAVALAAMLVHEFQHIRLSGLLRLIPLHNDDPRERFYAPWRDDPRPMDGIVQGVYAFFGVTMFWRALARASAGSSDRRAMFEFAYWRAVTWRTLRAAMNDASLTRAGHRFLSGAAQRLGRWQHETVPPELAKLAAAVAMDHYAGWRIRHIRPCTRSVLAVADGWLARRQHLAGLRIADDRAPTPVSDGGWSSARADLIRLAVTETPGGPALSEKWRAVPDATPADFDYASGRFRTAAHGYRAELAADPASPGAWVGLGLALSGLGARPSARALLTCPELVRAVHRRIRAHTADPAAPEELAEWIGRHLP